MTHQELDARSLALHRRVAERIRQDPSLIDVAWANLARWRGIATASDLGYLQEWEDLLSAGAEAALAVATEESERGAALRQSSPFAGILTPRERIAFLEAWKATHEAR